MQTLKDIFRETGLSLSGNLLLQFLAVFIWSEVIKLECHFF